MIEHPWEPPVPLDPLEDWVAPGASPSELRHRLRNLEARALEQGIERPTIDEGDILRYGGDWVALAPSEVCIARKLVASFNTCTSKEALGMAGLDATAQATFHTHVHRIRRRVGPLGLRIRTVRGHGLVLCPDGVAPRSDGLAPSADAVANVGRGAEV